MVVSVDVGNVMAVLDLFFFYCCGLHRDLHSFPTRRSSDLYSMPIAVRYTQDAFSRSGWLWPVDAKGEPLKATSYMAVGFYVAKYVNKKSDMDLAAKGVGDKEWRTSLPVQQER